MKGDSAPPPPPPPPSSNLIKNGGFENLKADWNESGLGAQTTAIITGNTQAGTRALEIPNAGGGQSQSIAISADKNYRLRAWAYVDSGAGWMGFGATFQDVAGNQLPAPVAERQVTASAWQEIVFEVDPPAGSVEMLFWIWKINGQGKGYIDEIKVEEVQ
ncbi:MAG: carbohydrate binding domain-containing protein [Limisphaerales bacterium]